MSSNPSETSSPASSEPSSGPDDLERVRVLMEELNLTEEQAWHALRHGLNFKDPEVAKRMAGDDPHALHRLMHGPTSDVEWL